MAGNRIEYDIAVLDKGGTIQGRTNAAKELNKELERTQKLASGTKSGDQAMRRAGYGEYTTAGGITGRGQAGARDFAAEAQGLGGLVRLYATLAANVYAAGAAFNALKSAADVTNMVEGMNQLGAASGVALGSLAKAFVAATDGAITLREAMQSVTKASAAGMSSVQILDIAKYAKTASQALGIDMTDAVSRLTRGITKLEPELLDELGIFTKIDPAVQKYANTLGKAASSLTDFERRQAFALAVLDEAKQKFGDIEMQANPFQKLEASIRDLSTATLQLVNKVLVPIVDVLANNTALLATALALLGAKLIGMAIPAIVGWRKELVESAKIAKIKAQEINELFGEKSFQATMTKFNLPELQKNLDSAKQKYAQAAKDIADIQAKQGVRATKTSKSIASGTFGEDPKDFTRTQAQINDLTKKGTKDADAYADALKRAKIAKQEELAITKQITAAETAAENMFKRTTLEERERARISRRAGATSERLGILSNIGGDVEVGGFGYAMEKMRQSVSKTADMNSWEKLNTKIQGTFIAGASRVMMFLRAFGNIGMVIGAALAAFSLLDEILGNTKKEQQAFDSAIEQSSETVKTATAVLNKYKEEITAQSVIAKGNIFIDLNDIVEKQITSLEELLNKMNRFSSIKDTVLDFFGFGARDDLAKSLGENFAQQLALIPEGPAKQALEEKLKAVLGASGTDKGALEDALDTIGRESLPAVAREANKLFTEAKNRAGEARDNVKSLEEAMKKARTSIGGIKTAMQLSDPASKFGGDLIDIGIKFAEGLKDSESTIANIKQLLGDKELIQLIDPEQYDRLSGLGKVYEDISKQITKLNAAGDPGGQLPAYVASLQMVFNDLNREATKIITRGFDLMTKQLDIASKRAQINVQQRLLGTLGAGPGVSEAKAGLETRDLELQKQQVNIVSELNKTLILNNALQAQGNAIEQLKLLREKAGKKELSVEDQMAAAQLDLRQSQLGGLIGGSSANLFSDLYTGIAASTETDPVVAAINKQLTMATKQAQDQIRNLSAMQAIVGVEKDIGKFKEELDLALQKNQAERESLEIQKQILDLQAQGTDIVSEELQQQINAKDNRLLELTQLDKKLKLESEIQSAELTMRKALEMNNISIANAANEIAKAKTKELESINKQIPLEDRLLEIRQKQFNIQQKARREEERRAEAQALRELKAGIAGQETELALQLAERQAGLSLLTPKDIAMIRGGIARSQTESEAQQAAARALDDYKTKLARIETERDLKFAAAGEAGLDKATIDRFKEQELAAETYYNTQVAGIERVKNAKLGLINLIFL